MNFIRKLKQIKFNKSMQDIKEVNFENKKYYIKIESYECGYFGHLEKYKVKIFDVDFDKLKINELDTSRPFEQFNPKEIIKIAIKEYEEEERVKRRENKVRDDYKNSKLIEL